MNKTLRTAIAAAGILSFSFAAQAACDPGKSVDDLIFEEAQVVYDCIAADLHAGYMKGDKKWIPAEFVADYRNWTPANTLPANPGFHGGRFLLTWINEVGAEEYLKFADEDVNIPAGAVIAKESFAVTVAGKVKKGPLFIMQKVEAGVSPETNDWYYMAVAPNGTPMAVNVMKACNECHMENYGFQGGLGYPDPEVRVGQ
ncbi:MAG: cytochrome P460 family protein [Alphaproteobacteria bacterium]